MILYISKEAWNLTVPRWKSSAIP